MSLWFPPFSGFVIFQNGILPSSDHTDYLQLPNRLILPPRPCTAAPSAWSLLPVSPPLTHTSPAPFIHLEQLSPVGVKRSGQNGWAAEHTQTAHCPWRGSDISESWCVDIQARSHPFWEALPTPQTGIAVHTCAWHPVHMASAPFTLFWNELSPSLDGGSLRAVIQTYSSLCSQCGKGQGTSQLLPCSTIRSSGACVFCGAALRRGGDDPYALWTQK